MRRPFKSTKRYPAYLGDIKSDFTTDQLAGIGAIAMNYNEVEGRIFDLFRLASSLPDALVLPVFTRINGVEGVLEIIKEGARDLFTEETDHNHLNELFGAFKDLKKYRDAVIHARAYNAPLGIGIRFDRRASVFEVLMSKSALDALYEHMSAVRLEIKEFVYLFLGHNEMKLVSSDQEKEQCAAIVQWSRSRAQDCRRNRLSLAPLPKFPSESELIKARDGWLAERIAAQTAAFPLMSEPPDQPPPPPQTGEPSPSPDRPDAQLPPGPDGAIERPQ